MQTSEEGPGLGELASDGLEDGSLDADNSDNSDLVDVGHSLNSTFADCTFNEQLSKHIQELRDFCNGLEYQHQFHDQQFLNSLESTIVLVLSNNKTQPEDPNLNTWLPGTANAMFYCTSPRPEDRDM